MTTLENGKIKNVFLNYAIMIDFMRKKDAHVYLTHTATYVHKVVGVGFLINTKTSIIEDAMVTLISDLCKEFLAHLIVGHNIQRDGIDEIVEKVEKRFFGYSRKAVVVAMKGAHSRYLQWKKENGKIGGK